MTATATWRIAAWAAMRELAGVGAPFTSDDLIDRVGTPDFTHEPNGRNNAVGSIFREAHAAGLIEPTGEVVKSRQPHRKGGVVRIWRGTDRQPDLWSPES